WAGAISADRRTIETRHLTARIITASIVRGKRSCAVHHRLLDVPVARILHTVNDSSRDNRSHYLSCQLAAVERRVVGERARVRSFERPALLRVEDRDVGKAAAGQ